MRVLLHTCSSQTWAEEFKRLTSWPLPTRRHKHPLPEAKSMWPLLDPSRLRGAGRWLHTPRCARTYTHSSASRYAVPRDSSLQHCRAAHTLVCIHTYTYTRICVLPATLTHTSACTRGLRITLLQWQELTPHIIPKKYYTISEFLLIIVWCLVCNVLYFINIYNGS